MSDEPENLTLRLLQEMRADMGELRNEIRGRFDGIEARFDDLETRVDGNTLILNMIAGLVHNHEQRLDTVEARQN